MDWFTFYNENKNSGTINEIVQAYNTYVFQNQSPQVMEASQRMLGTNRMILQENSYVLIQEGVNQYGLLQELGNDKNLR
jgi:hypothetical protein